MLTLLSNCAKKGCTDSTASNFEEKAKKDDGSCTYPNEGDAIAVITSPSGVSVESSRMVKFDFDGSAVLLEVGVNGVQHYSGKTKNYDGINSNAVFFSQLYPSMGGAESFTVSKGKLVFPGAFAAPNGDFEAFFTKGVYAMDSTASEEDVFFSFVDANGVVYSSKSSSQTGSNFEILDVKDVSTSSSQILKVLAVFNVKMYNESDITDVKEITNGELVLQFKND